MLWSLRPALALALLLPAAALNAYAQEHRAAIRGVVVDPSAKGISNVEVRVAREDTGETLRVRTHENGLFTARSVSVRSSCTGA